MSYNIRGIAACVLLQLLAAATIHAAPLANFRLQVEDLSDNPIETVLLGQDFQLAAYVEDIRDPAAQFPGVWAAFMHVAYDAGLVSITSLPVINPNPGDPGNNGDPGIEWGDFFDTGLRFGDLSAPGQIDGIGSASLARVQSGPGDFLVWRITIHTSALGTATFSPAFDSDPDHESSFIDPPNQLTAGQIQFIGDSVQIVPEPSSLVLAALGLIGLVVLGRRKRVVDNGVAAARARSHSRSVVVALCAVSVFSCPRTSEAGTIVSFEFTNFGSVQVELFNSEAPQTVANFLSYVTAGRYNDTMIHRVDTPLGVIQGGGYTKTTIAVATAADPTVPLEYSHPNTRGTLGMARIAAIPNSATSQWYFNTDDNSTQLDPSNSGGYAVFGQVLGNGMDVIDAIAALQVFSYPIPFGQMPLQNFSTADFNSGADPKPHVIVLHSVTIVPEPSSFVLAAFGLVGLSVWRRRRR